MICFFDTSALIKKYINELGTELVRFRLQSTSVVVSSVAKIECISVISRMTANHEMSAEEFNNMQRQIEKDFSIYEVVPFSEATEKIAMEMVKKHLLRTLDAIQLASALSVHDLNYFFVSDIKLKVSGKAEGLSVIDPNETQP